MPDFTTPTGQVRLLIADVSTDLSKRLLSEEEVAGFLALNDGHVRRAAADALDAIASSETLVSKAIRTQDLQTDGPKVASDLRAHAARLRQQADDEDAVDIFDVVWPASGCRPELTEFPTSQVWGL